MDTGNSPSGNPNTLALLAHLLGFAGYLVPFGNIIGPLIVWQTNKESPFVADQAKEAMNFQITVTIAHLIAFALWCVAVGIPLTILITVYSIVMMIIAAVRANAGVSYRYPFTLRLVS